MTIPLAWSEITGRLICALAAGGLIGMNRSKHGRAAGLRTSILACLAACIAILQVNLVLPLAGRSPDSFIMNDLMRLPLGILSGMGLIGAGAIVHRANFVIRVMTAAIMWFLTVVGLCLGGSQVALELVATAVGMLVLTVLKLVEDRMQQDQQGMLRVVTGASGPRRDRDSGGH